MMIHELHGESLDDTRPYVACGNGMRLTGATANVLQNKAVVVRSDQYQRDV